MAFDDNSSDSAVQTTLGAIFISIELSQSKWLITSLSPGRGDRMSKHVVAAGNVPDLMELLRNLGEQAETKAGRTFPVVSIQEAGLDGFWIHRILESEGVESYVVDPASIATSRRRRAPKPTGSTENRCFGPCSPTSAVIRGSARWWCRRHRRKKISAATAGNDVG